MVYGCMVLFIVMSKIQIESKSQPLDVTVLAKEVVYSDVKDTN